MSDVLWNLESALQLEEASASSGCDPPEGLQVWEAQNTRDAASSTNQLWIVLRFILSVRFAMENLIRSETFYW